MFSFGGMLSNPVYTKIVLVQNSEIASNLWSGSKTSQTHRPKIKICLACSGMGLVMYVLQRLDALLESTLHTTESWR